MVSERQELVRTISLAILAISSVIYIFQLADIYEVLVKLVLSV